MNKPKVLIFGSSGHAKVIIDIFEKQGTYEIVGLLDSYESIGEKVLGYPIVGSETTIPKEILNIKNLFFFIAVGDNWNRQIVYKKIVKLAPDAKYATAIHPFAQIGKNVRIGRGTAVMAGGIINSDSEVGDFAIINTNASLGHDGKMFDYSSLAPGVAIGGNVSIGNYSAICIGATVINKLSIGEHSLIGASSLLTKDCADHKVMYGVPAKVIRSRPDGEEYIK